MDDHKKVNNHTGPFTHIGTSRLEGLVWAQSESDHFELIILSIAVKLSGFS